MRGLRHGDRRRGRAPLNWLLIRGRGDRPLDAQIRSAEVVAHSSSKRPSVRRGDRAILYAAVWQALYGVVEVIGDPENDPARTRWAWRFAIRPETLVGDLHDAPPVEAAGIFPQSLWRHSHIRLTDEQFERARWLVEAAAGASGDRHPTRPEGSVRRSQKRRPVAASQLDESSDEGQQDEQRHDDRSLHVHKTGHGDAIFP